MTTPPLLDPNLAAGLKRRFLPYAPHSLAALLPLRVQSVTVDDLPVTEDAVRVDRLRIRPHVVQAWRRVQVVFAMAPMDAALRELAKLGSPPPGMRYVLRVRCPDTRLRHTVTMLPQADALVGTITLSRDDVEGSVFVEAAAVLAEATKPADARANEELTWLARSPRWIVEVEEADVPAGGAFDFAWVDFADPKPEAPYRGEDAGHLARCPSALSHVVMRPNGPLVLINKHHETVATVLQSRGTVGASARLRDVLLGRVAVESWRTILLTAVHEVEGTGPSHDEAESAEIADLGEDHWTSNVLRHAAKVARCSRDELVRRLAEPSTRGGFLFEVSETLGKVGNETVRKLIEEMQAG